MNAIALYQLTNLLPQQINLYGFITDNEYRISDILNHLKSTGSSLKEIISTNNYSFIDKLIPQINLGRQAGNTYTIKKFIEHNDNLKIGIMTLNFQVFNENYKQHKNVFWINPKDKEMKSLRGRTVDYIIMDCWQLRKEKYIEYIISDIFRTGTIIMCNPKIIGIG